MDVPEAHVDPRGSRGLHSLFRLPRHCCVLASLFGTHTIRVLSLFPPSWALRSFSPDLPLFFLFGNFFFGYNLAASLA